MAFLDESGLLYQDGIIKSAINTKITDPDSKANGQVLTYNGTSWVAENPADTGVLTVNGANAIAVDSANASSPVVSLTIDPTPGNITLTQSATGLVANAGANSLTVGVLSDAGDIVTHNTSEFDANGAAADAEANAKAHANGLVEALDGVVTNAPAANSTLTVFSETDGVVTATFAPISIVSSQVSDAGSAITHNATAAVTANSTDLVTSGAVFDVVKDLTGFHFEIVDTLPVTGETNIIYLILKSTTSSGNIYHEYIWVQTGEEGGEPVYGYELIGDTQLDITALTNQEIADSWANAVPV